MNTQRHSHHPQPEQGATQRDAAIEQHGANPHSSTQAHHRHSHTHASQHTGGHHLLQVEDLSVSFTLYEPHAPFFKARRKPTEVIRNLHVSVHTGEIVAIVGASGSGKTLLADAIMGIFAPNATVKGHVWFDGVEQNAASLAALRGKGISLVPQSVTSLDPLMKVGQQILGAQKRLISRHKAEGLPNATAALPSSADMATTDSTLIPTDTSTAVASLLAHYGLPPSTANLYPHQLSGGMTRRVLLCCALMDMPRLIIADEPTPGLDLELALRALAHLRDFADKGGGVLLITHDIELALGVADRVAVFSEGTVVEETAVANFASPHTLEHPFSKQLWHALPEHNFATGAKSSVNSAVGTTGSSTHATVAKSNVCHAAEIAEGSTGHA